MLIRQFHLSLSKLTYFIYFRRHYSNRNILKLHERGMYQDVFPADSNQEIMDLLNSGPQYVYAGFDPTANSLHVGNLLVLANLLHWQRSGHKVIALIGGATSEIGDPSGRSTERSELSKSIIAKNASSIERNIINIFNNHQEIFWKDKAKTEPLLPLKLVNNCNWYSDMSALKFVGQLGRHFRMGTMLSRHSVQTRLNSDTGMSFTEFSYQLFQAYDWLHLFKKYNCCFQVGGSDQMGNMMSGQELISRCTNTRVYGLTLPIVTTESGDKFGKSAGNAVWLNANKTSPFELYQFFVRTKDSEVETLLKLFTFESVGSIQDLIMKHKANPEARLAQKKLAEQVTLLVHGEKGLASAQQVTAALYDSSVESLGQLAAQDLLQVFRGASSCELLQKPGMTTLELALAAKCFPTESDAIRIMTAGGFYINHQRIKNIHEILTQAAHILPNNVSLIRVGKKNYYVVKWLS